MDKSLRTFNTLMKISKAKKFSSRLRYIQQLNKINSGGSIVKVKKDNYGRVISTPNIKTVSKGYLNGLDGYEFQELTADIFRKIGYKKVKVQPYSRDEGRDILMEEHKYGKVYPVVVECKHQHSLIGRPVIQKLHSATLMLEGKSKKKGIVITTGKFSREAIDYTNKVNSQDKDNLGITLIDFDELRELIKKTGTSIFSNQKNASGDLSFPYSDYINTLEILKSELGKIRNFSESSLKIHSVELIFKPCFYFEYKINSSFKTSIGLIHSINREDTILLDGETGKAIDEKITHLVVAGIDNERPINKVDGVKVKKESFGFSERIIKTKVITQIIEENTKEVEYAGNNNVTYQKTCEPSLKDITLLDYRLVYIPNWTISFSIKNQNYLLSFIEGHKNISFNLNDLEKCNFCENNDGLCFCNSCGTISCDKHINQCIKCKKWYCGTCSINCERCGSVLCKEDYKTCSICKKKICDDCSSMCKKCGKTVCSKHTENCKICGKLICEKCVLIKKKFLLFNNYYCSEACLNKKK